MSRKVLAAVAAAAWLTASTVMAAGLTDLRVFPNPARVARGDTAITFDAILGGDLKIFNSAGRLVLEKSFDPAQTNFVWDLKNNDGKSVASGVYVYVLDSAGEQRTGKIGIIR